MRVTLGFAGAMAVVLAATGLFVYLQLQANLDHTIAQGLRSRAGDISALVQQSDTGLRDAGTTPSRGPVAGFAQIIDARTGRVFDATPGLRARPLLAGGALRAAQHASAPTLLDRSHAPADDTPIRLLATPVEAQGRHLVIVVGAALEDRDHALANLATLLVTGGLAALLLASLAGYGLATAALRPVEAMRRRAASITAHRLAQRLPLGARHDELHRLGQTLNDMLARLQAGLERERAFTADASHELRTPLTLIKTELELIARDRPEGRELDQAARAAIEEADRLACLVDDLLVIARSDSDQLSLDRREISVSDLLTAIRAGYAQTAPAARIHVQAPPELMVHADAGRLRQALGNLADNALRHGREPILIRGEARHGCVELHVEDHGPGLPPAFLPHAFERFARAAPTRSPDGAGLGLAIVDAVAQSHGGAAHIANRPGGGTHAWITIPRVEPAPRSAGTEQPVSVAAP